MKQRSEALKRARFNLKIDVKPKDIDDLGQVNNAVDPQWVQLAAASHWNALSTTDKIRSTCLWVALRHKIDYISPAFLGDVIAGYTWVSAVDGVRSLRHVEFYRGRQVSGKSTDKIGAATLKPRRIGHDIKALLES
ncbi:MAG TPA: thioesterase family protein [Cyclobacteriaceae bacterium]|nr:thioesterase family protein [Cyclobacteriaceae bacterium]